MEGDESGLILIKTLTLIREDKKGQSRTGKGQNGQGRAMKKIETKE